MHAQAEEVEHLLAYLTELVHVAKLSTHYERPLWMATFEQFMETYDHSTQNGGLLWMRILRQFADTAAPFRTAFNRHQRQTRLKLDASILAPTALWAANAAVTGGSITASAIAKVGLATAVARVLTEKALSGSRKLRQVQDSLKSYQDVARILIRLTKLTSHLLLQICGGFVVREELTNLIYQTMSDKATLDKDLHGSLEELLSETKPTEKCCRTLGFKTCPPLHHFAMTPSALQAQVTEKPGREAQNRAFKASCALSFSAYYPIFSKCSEQRPTD
jgi:hypothetical protein